MRAAAVGTLRRRALALHPLIAFLACVQHGSMLFNQGLATGRLHTTTRPPAPRSARRFCSCTHWATTSAVCQEASSQMTIKDPLPCLGHTLAPPCQALHWHLVDWWARPPYGGEAGTRPKPRRMCRPRLAPSGRRSPARCRFRLRPRAVFSGPERRGDCPAAVRRCPPGRRPS
jgi:hypothetical protein